MILPLPRSTLFPYTTLFRSCASPQHHRRRRRDHRALRRPHRRARPPRRAAAAGRHLCRDVVAPAGSRRAQAARRRPGARHRCLAAQGPCRGGEVSEQDLADKIRSGDRRALARGITLVESRREDHRLLAEKLLDLVMPKTGKSIRLGISGPPGVGKSTFIESFGQYLIEAGHKVAVLAIDPSSKISGGSILGDKTRMTELSRRKEAFIRPSPAGETLGGVARRTREALLLCEAAGFDVVIVETVGVGQSETAVAEMTDMFLLLLSPGGGDDLQGVKRGVMELADLLIVNKADGDLAAAAERTASDYARALRLMHALHEDWQPSVVKCSALKGEGMATVWDKVQAFRKATAKTGEFESRRRDQARNWLWQEVSDGLLDRVKSDPDLADRLAKLETRVGQRKASPAAAARSLLSSFFKGLGD